MGESSSVLALVRGEVGSEGVVRFRGPDGSVIFAPALSLGFRYFSLGLLARQLRIFERRDAIIVVQVVAGGPCETSSGEDSSTGCMGRH
jgi:hypothetical protein